MYKTYVIQNTAVGGKTIYLGIENVFWIESSLYIQLLKKTEIWNDILAAEVITGIE